MKTVVVANPAAQGGRVGKDWLRWTRRIERGVGPFEAQFSSGPGDTTLLVRRLVAEGVERIGVVGGDGTVNEAVNGFFDEGGEPLGSEAALFVVPAGTGGDFVRSIGLAEGDFGELMQHASVRCIDIGRAELTTSDGAPLVRHFANISSFGSSGLIVELVNKSSKRFGAKGSFLLGTLQGLWQYENQRVRLKVDDGPEEEITINTVAVANGRYFGGSMKVAPNARLDDGLFDITVIGDMGLLQFVLSSRRIYAGTHLSLPKVRSLRGRVVTATPVDGARVLIDLDGEQPGTLPVRYEVLPAAINLFAPWGQAEALSS